MFVGILKFCEFLLFSSQASDIILNFYSEEYIYLYFLNLALTLFSIGWSFFFSAKLRLYPESIELMISARSGARG